ncbi:hypothetical protein OJAV_G00048990 [Oryzias javanicus]|uniref:Uncharacterized protein n=1 Tax=Oryzias javanicus TaxID=123683 RepID=A0A437DEY6_ORYJA|nr:hypothetical protein OJAV_G00048990 [Oryzias javanicus]
MGGARTDRPPVGAGERGGGPDEQRAGPGRDVQQGAAHRDLLRERPSPPLNTRSLHGVMKAGHISLSLVYKFTVLRVYLTAHFWLVPVAFYHSVVDFKSVKMKAG